MSARERDLTAAQERGHLVGVEPREVRHGYAPPPALSPPRMAGTTKWLSAAFGGVGEGVVHAEGRRHDIVAQDVRELDRLGRGRDVLGVEGREHGVLVEDVVQLPFEARQLVLGQTEAREMGDVLDIGTSQGGHARDDTGPDRT